MSAESCNKQENISLQTTQELIDSVLEDDRITECDKEELYEIIERKEQDENIIRSIAHQELRDFIQNEGLNTPWFQDYKQAQESDDMSWMTHMRDNIYQAIQENPDSYWEDNTGDIRGAISYLILKSGESFGGSRDLLAPITLNGELFVSDGVRLFNISQLQLEPLDDIRTIDTQSIITENGKTFFKVQYESSRAVTHVTLEGEAYFSSVEENDRIDVNSRIDINGIIFFENQRDGETILVSRNGETLFQGKGLDGILPKVGVTEYEGKEYICVAEGNTTYLMSTDGNILVQGEFNAIYEVEAGENNSLIIHGRGDDYKDKTITIEGESDTSREDNTPDIEMNKDSLLSEAKKEELMRLHGLTSLDNSQSFELNGKKYFVGRLRNQDSLMLYGADGKGALGGFYSFKEIDLGNIEQQGFQTSEGTNWVQWIPVKLKGGENKWYSPEREELINSLIH